ncbi:hypothetical protein HDU93_002587 [Gonapodya sp. JEL0774]|nr:hypothetical protein HDU93_002587 [Gonapodya sp. JEL0774]
MEVIDVDALDEVTELRDQPITFESPRIDESDNYDPEDVGWPMSAIETSDAMIIDSSGESDTEMTREEAPDPLMYALRDPTPYETPTTRRSSLGYTHQDFRNISPRVVLHLATPDDGKTWRGWPKLQPPSPRSDASNSTMSRISHLDSGEANRSPSPQSRAHQKKRKRSSVVAGSRTRLDPDLEVVVPEHPPPRVKMNTPKPEPVLPKINPAKVAEAKNLRLSILAPFLLSARSLSIDLMEVLEGNGVENFLRGSSAKLTPKPIMRGCPQTAVIPAKIEHREVMRKLDPLHVPFSPNEIRLLNWKPGDMELQEWRSTLKSRRAEDIAAFRQDRALGRRQGLEARVFLRVREGAFRLGGQIIIGVDLH